jgi:Protein of unknown function (DUF2911)
MRKKLIWTLIGVAVLLLGLFVTTGISLLPPSLVLGPCLKDFTSPLSYRPRVSPLASVSMRFGPPTREVRLCYGRPAARGRKIFGGLVPFDSLWRMGANEPTRLYVSGPVRLAGLALPAGRYSLYAIPHRDRWEIFASRSTLHWGNDISPAVRAREMGSISAPAESLAAPVETLTVTADTSGPGPALLLEWERTRISLPFSAGP